MKLKCIRFLMLFVFALIPIYMWGHSREVRTIKDAFNFDHNISYSVAAKAATDVYRMMKLADDELVLWQSQVECVLALESDVDRQMSFKCKHKDGTKPLKMWHMV